MVPGDLVVLSSHYKHVLKTRNIPVSRTPGLVIDLIDYSSRDGLGSEEVSAMVLWPDGRISEVNTIFIETIQEYLCNTQKKK